LDQAEQDADVHRAFEVIAALGGYKGENYTVEEFLRRTHFPRRAWHYLDSRLGVEHGTSLDRLAMRGFVTYERGWEARETNYTLAQPYESLFAPTIAALGENLVLNCPVAAIEWKPAPRVFTEDGRHQDALAVIFTGSVVVLRRGVVRFDPPLPPDKLHAASAIGMDAGMKIILRFKDQFWDDRMYFLHTDGLLPQYWVTGKGKSQRGKVLTAFVGGSRADALLAMGVDPVRFALEELDEVFGAKIASRAFDRGLVADWTANRFIGGLYSFPTTATTEADREGLARPLGNSLFFAGEASDTGGHSGTVHGAIETGRRAAAEVVALFG
jgi:monoamine oxidase